MPVPLNETRALDIVQESSKSIDGSGLNTDAPEQSLIYYSEMHDHIACHSGASAALEKLTWAQCIGPYA